jgi:hypothetical protein
VRSATPVGGEKKLNMRSNPKGAKGKKKVEEKEEKSEQ